MSIWLKAAVYSLAGAILGSIIIGMLFSGAGMYPQGGYASGLKMGTGMNRGNCMDRR